MHPTEFGWHSAPQMMCAPRRKREGERWGRGWRGGIKKPLKWLRDHGSGRAPC